MPMKVDAAILYQTNSPLIVETLDLDEPAAGEVLVKIEAAGVCHSDYQIISGQAKHTLPVVLGHEGAGTVAAVGKDVDRVKLGDHVALSWIPYCGDCFYCHHEQTHLCKAYIGPLWDGTMLDGSCRFSKDGKTYYHLSMLACWADHVVVPQESCIIMRNEVPFEIAALLGCGVTTGVGAVVNRAQVKPGSSAVVFGAGGVGMSLIMGAHLAGASPLIAIDITDAKESMARELGATHFLLADADITAQVRDLTGGRGADYVFEAVGRPELQQRCLELTRPGGMLTLVGMPGNDETTQIPGAEFIRDEKVITGSIFGSSRTDRDFMRFANLYLEGKLPIDKLVARRYRLDEINQACADMLDGAPGRGVIVFAD